MVSPNWKTNYFSKWKSNFDTLWSERSAPPAETASPTAASPTQAGPSDWADPAADWTWTGRNAPRTTWTEPERTPVQTANVSPNFQMPTYGPTGQTGPTFPESQTGWQGQQPTDPYAGFTLARLGRRS